MDGLGFDLPVLISNEATNKRVYTRYLHTIIWSILSEAETFGSADSNKSRNKLFWYSQPLKAPYPNVIISF